jgi:hypothetical protein
MYGGRARVVIHPVVAQEGSPIDMRARVEGLIRRTYDGLAGGA